MFALSVVISLSSDPTRRADSEILGEELLVLEVFEEILGDGQPHFVIHAAVVLSADNVLDRI